MRDALRVFHVEHVKNELGKHTSIIRDQDGVVLFCFSTRYGNSPSAVQVRMLSTVCDYLNALNAQEEQP
jgi:hypothetical protein